MKIIPADQLIAESARTGHRIVTRSPVQAEALMNQASQRGLTIFYPMTYDDFVHANYDWRVPGLLIDCVNDLMQFIAQAPIQGVTLAESEV